MQFCVSISVVSGVALSEHHDSWFDYNPLSCFVIIGDSEAPLMNASLLCPLINLY